jgi:hypothetical protein
MVSAPMSLRFRTAMFTFSALGLLAFITLSGKIRLATLILLGGFAAKTWLAEMRRRQGD